MTNTWTVNSTALTLVNVPTNQNLGCNPANVPTAAQKAAGVTANNACGSGTVSATSADTANGSLMTRIYTISAIDGCGNAGTAR